MIKLEVRAENLGVTVVEIWIRRMTVLLLLVRIMTKKEVLFLAVCVSIFWQLTLSSLAPIQNQTLS